MTKLITIFPRSKCHYYTWHQGNHHTMSNLIVHGVTIVKLPFGVPSPLCSDRNFTIMGGDDFHDVKKGLSLLNVGLFVLKILPSEIGTPARRKKMWEDLRWTPYLSSRAQGCLGQIISHPSTLGALRFSVGHFFRTFAGTLTPPIFSWHRSALSLSVPSP